MGVCSQDLIHARQTMSTDDITSVYGKRLYFQHLRADQSAHHVHAAVNTALKPDCSATLFSMTQICPLRSADCDPASCSVPSYLTQDKRTLSRWHAPQRHATKPASWTDLSLWTRPTRPLRKNSSRSISRKPLQTSGLSRANCEPLSAG